MIGVALPPPLIGGESVRLAGKIGIVDAAASGMVVDGGKEGAGG
jgi:hypothetical protein